MAAHCPAPPLLTPPRSYERSSSSSCLWCISGVDSPFPHVSSRLQQFSPRWSSPFVSRTKAAGTCRLRRRRCVPLLRPRTVRAKQADDLPPPAEMTYEGALELLGVTDGASFDDILSAKKRRLEAVGENPELALRVEAAYDILLMQSLSRRRAGAVVDYSIKYADVRRPAPASSSSSTSATPAWVQAVSRVTKVSLGKPDTADVATRAAVFGILAAWTYAQGLGQPDVYSPYGSSASGADVPGLQLALGVGASIYFLRKDNVGLGKAMALTFGALTFGGLLGGFLQSWVRVDIFPLLGVSSPAVFIGEWSVIFLLLSCLYLR